jgi:AsmA-like C-terminal region
MAWLGLPSALAPATAFELEGAFSSAKAAARLSAFTLTHDATTATGQLSLARQQNGLALDGAIQTNELRLPAFWRKSGARQDWSSAGLSWLPLPEIKGHLEVNATTLALQKWRLSEARALLEFEGQTARVTATANDGAVELSLSAKGAAAPEFGFKMKLDDVSAAEALPSLADYSWLQGVMDLEIDASAKGGNIASLVSTLTGHTSMDLRKGRLSGYSLKDLLADAGKGWRSAPGDATNGLTVAVSGNIAEGIVTLQPTRLKADDLDLGVSGEIDLLRQAVDLRLEANGASDLTAKPGVSGSWYDPDFGAATAQSQEPPVPAPSAN